MLTAKNEDESIVVVRAETDNLKGINVQIPHKQLTVVYGPGGVGKTALCKRTLVSETTYRLQGGVHKNKTTFSLKNARRMHSKQAQYESLSGLLPAIYISAIENSFDPPLQELLGLRELLCSLYLLAGSVHCVSCDEELHQNPPLKVINEIFSELDSREHSTKQCLVISYFPQRFILEITKNIRSPLEALRSLLQIFIAIGYNRFMLNDQLYKGPKEGEDELKKTFESALKKAAKNKTGFGVVVDRVELESKKASHDRLLHAIHKALELGSPAAILWHYPKNTPSGEDLGDKKQWLTAPGYFCKRCSQAFPKLSAVVLEDQIFSHQVRIKGVSFPKAALLSVIELHLLLQEVVGAEELQRRLSKLISLGFRFTKLSSTLSTLSTGERLKVLLYRNVLEQLFETLFVVEEPSQILHPQDLVKSFSLFKELTAQGNTVVVTECHDELPRFCDYVIELGDGAGKKGGYLRFAGEVRDWSKVRIERSVPRKSARNDTSFSNSKVLQVQKGALFQQHTEIKLPLGALVSVVGVSGAGKTTLFYTMLEEFKKQKKSKKQSLLVSGLQEVKDVRFLPQGEPFLLHATVGGLLGVEERIAEIFSSQTLAREMGLSSNFFSLGKKDGRCEGCRGSGKRRNVFGHFGAIDELCDQCGGRRFSVRVLKVHFKGLSISEVLELSIEEGVVFFSGERTLSSMLLTALNFGVRHLKLGQFLSSLSFTEGKLLRLSALLDGDLSSTLYLLDQPFSGAAVDESVYYMKRLKELINNGASFFVISHEVPVIECSDYIVELGEGGDVIFQGSPQGRGGFLDRFHLLASANS